LEVSIAKEVKSRQLNFEKNLFSHFFMGLLHDMGIIIFIHLTRFNFVCYTQMHNDFRILHSICNSERLQNEECLLNQERVIDYGTYKELKRGSSFLS
jgi:hypothetical protein